VLQRSTNLQRLKLELILARIPGAQSLRAKSPVWTVLVKVEPQTEPTARSAFAKNGQP